MTHSKLKLVLLSFIGLLGLGLAVWLLLPFVVNRTADEVSPLTPTTAGVIPVLPDQTLEAPILKLSGNFEPRAHRAEGLAQIIKIDSAYTLRLEDLNVLSGPDLRVYLATDDNADQFIDLGPLKANRGDLNYILDTQTAPIDFEHYDTVLIWCRAFGVLFASATLEAWPE